MRKLPYFKGVKSSGEIVFGDLIRLNGRCFINTIQNIPDDVLTGYVKMTDLFDEVKPNSVEVVENE